MLGLGHPWNTQINCTDKSTLAQMLKLFIRLLNLPGVVGTGVVGGGGTLKKTIVAFIY